MAEALSVEKGGAMRPSRWIAIEAAVNTVTGTGLAVLVLVLFGIPMSTSVVINVIMTALSFARSYVLRSLFRRIYG